MTFGDGMIVRELIERIDENERCVVCLAVDGSLTHHTISATMEPGMTVMKQTLDCLAGAPQGRG